MTFELAMGFLCIFGLILCAADAIRNKIEEQKERGKRKAYYRAKSQIYRAEVLRNEHTN